MPIHCSPVFIAVTSYVIYREELRTALAAAGALATIRSNDFCSDLGSIATIRSPQSFGVIAFPSRLLSKTVVRPHVTLPTQSEGMMFLVGMTICVTHLCYHTATHLRFGLLSRLLGCSQMDGCLVRNKSTRQPRHNHSTADV